MKRFLIVAAENSAENYALQVIRQAKKSGAAVSFHAVGGDRLAEAGAELWVHSRELAVVGIVEVLLHLSRILSILGRLHRRAQAEGIDAALLIDAPDFNLRLARRLKKAGIPVFYYISPTVWAWRYRRIHLVRRLVTRMFIIFPFEVDIYRREGIPFTYAGHPMLADLQPPAPARETRERLGIPADRRLLVLMPGSRPQEVRELLPRMIGALRILRRDFPVKAVIVRARNIGEQWLRGFLDGEGIAVVPQEDRFDVIHAADAALTTHGTSNLEIALSGTPFVAAYRVHRLSYFLGRWLLKIDLFSIVNILAGERVVAELVQDECRPERMAEEVARIFTDPEVGRRMRESFGRIRGQLDQERSAAEIVWETIDRESEPDHAGHRRTV